MPFAVGFRNGENSKGSKLTAKHFTLDWEGAGLHVSPDLDPVLRGVLCKFCPPPRIHPLHSRPLTLSADLVAGPELTALHG